MPQNIFYPPRGGVRRAVTGAKVIKNRPGFAFSILARVAGNVTLNDSAAVTGGTALFTGAVVANQKIPINKSAAVGLALTAATTAVVDVTFN